jgi:hypothetical protein
VLRYAPKHNEPVWKAMKRLPKARAIALLLLWGCAVAVLDSIYPTARLSLRTVAFALTAGGGLGVANAVLLERMRAQEQRPRRTLARKVTLTALVFVGSLVVGVAVVSIDWGSALSLGDETTPALFLAAAGSTLVGGLLSLERL